MKNSCNPKRFTKIIITLISCIFLSACSESKTVELQPRPIKVVSVQYQQAETTARYSGEIRARHESPLSFQVGGKLLKRLVEVGTVVERGQLLATLDQTDVRLEEAGATAQLAAVQAELDQARKDLNHLGKLQEKELASQAAWEHRVDQVRAAEARVVAAQASQSTYVRKSGYAELRADRAGVITSVDAEPGQIISAGQAVIRLAQTDEKEVVISVPENRLQDLRAATAINVNLWADPEHFYEARLREVSPGVDAVLRTYTVKLSVLGADAKVGMGMTATVHIQKKEAQPVTWLPLTALTQDNGQPAVWVFNPATETVQARTVTVLSYDNQNAKLLGGVTEGESVVVAGVHKLLAGQKVRLLGAKP